MTSWASREAQVPLRAAIEAVLRGGARCWSPMLSLEESLTELALNLRASWHHGTDELWRALDPELWSLTHNPWVVRQTASRVKIRELLARPDYRSRVEALGHASVQLTVDTYGHLVPGANRQPWTDWMIQRTRPSAIQPQPLAGKQVARTKTHDECEGATYETRDNPR